MLLDAKENINVDVKFALPGKERQDSVYSGLEVCHLSIIYIQILPLLKDLFLLYDIYFSIVSHALHITIFLKFHL